MPRKNVWLDDQALTDLDALMARWGCSQGEAVRRALANAAKSKK